MQIDRDLILKLEQLTRLQLSESERERLAADLNEILAMVERLQEVDTEGVAPLVYVNEPEDDRSRPDRVSGQVSREAALQNAPAQDGQFFRVPKVIDLKK